MSAAQGDTRMLYAHGTAEPAPLPDRIILPDGRVRSDPSTYTAGEIADAGYVMVEPPPECAIDQEVGWIAGDGTAGWVISMRDEIIQWQAVRNRRDGLMQAFSWRIDRWHRNDRLGRFQPDTIASLDAYMEALADLTLQRDPFRIDWPALPGPAPPPRT
ncbi:MAG: hypothetical protein EBT09_00130 [Actinobacteria bacterium]|nr:hypothetical protein [Actinomycetota bacterium]